MPAPPEQVLFPYDYCYLWSAGRVVLSGGNPYDLQTFTDAMYQLGWPRDESIWGFTHPPWIFWIYTPFSMLGFETARWLWTAAMSGLVVLLASTLRQLSRGPSRSLENLPFPLLLFALFCFPPTMKTLAFGQVSLVIAAGLAAALVWLDREQDFQAGLALSLTLIKPHLLVPFYIAVLLRCARQGRWSLLQGMAVGFLAQAGVSAWIYPGGWADYLEYVPRLIRDSPQLPGATIIQIASFRFDLPEVRLPVLGLGILAGIHYGLRTDRFAVPEMLRLLPLCLLLSPYSFSHEMVLLAPGYLLLVNRLHDRHGERAAATMCLASALVGLAMLAFIRFEYLSILIPTLLLAVTLRPHPDGRRAVG